MSDIFEGPEAEEVYEMGRQMGRAAYAGMTPFPATRPGWTDAEYVAYITGWRVGWRESKLSATVDRQANAEVDDAISRGEPPF